MYPKHYFKNDKFFDDELFLKITKDSDEFWQSCFIIIENKSLRQSSKIYDYTKYIINNSDIDYDKKKFFESIKLSFIKYFPIFTKSIKNRQQKIIISFTSYPKRFYLIPTVLKSLYEQTFPITKIVLTLSKEDKKYFNLNISNIDIITTNEDLRPHNKYYYAMKKYRDYAIMTIDDDLYYAKDTIKSLFFSYLENPNIIIGRRSHYMTYERNGELKSYQKWKFRQIFKKEPDFNTFLTGVGCILYPPDILNINDNYLPIINETITSDDITLKYFASQKGIPHKWVKNKFIHGMIKIIPPNTGNPLSSINYIKNDININKLEIAINHIIVKNLCVPYRGIQTGLTIHLFYIHNIIIMNNTTKFNIIAYSFCEIDKRIQFYIYFEKSRANCNFNINNINKENTNNLIATCTIDGNINNLNNYYFPKAFSHNNIQIKINNYRKYLTIIFNNFNCKQADNCILNALFYQNVSKGYILEIKINDTEFLCKLNEDVKYLNTIFPIMKDFKCQSNPKKVFNRKYISGLPTKFWFPRKNNNITNIFTIARIVNDISSNNLFIIGKLYDNLETNLYNLTIDLVYPKKTINCSLHSTSKYVKAYIYCKANNNSDILIENQIIFTDNTSYKLLLYMYYCELHFFHYYQNLFGIIGKIKYKKSKNKKN